MVSKTCYFTKEELRAVQEIADREERGQAKIVQFAVRTFANLYRTDPDKARQLAQSPTAK